MGRMITRDQYALRGVHASLHYSRTLFIVTEQMMGQRDGERHLCPLCSAVKSRRSSAMRVHRKDANPVM